MVRKAALCGWAATAARTLLLISAAAMARPGTLFPAPDMESMTWSTWPCITNTGAEICGSTTFGNAQSEASLSPRAKRHEESSDSVEFMKPTTHLLCARR